MTNQPPAKPPREFWLIPYYDEFDCLSWEMSITPPDETSTIAKDVEPIRVVDADYASRLEQELAFVKTQWKQTSDLLEQERNRLTAELADVRKELEKHRWRQVGAQVDPTPEAYAVLEAERDQAIKERDELKRELAQARAEFKNFHRNVCQAARYGHDDIDWKRDQASLEEWVRKGLEDRDQALSQAAALAGALEDICHPNMRPEGPAQGAIDIARSALAAYRAWLEKERGR